MPVNGAECKQFVAKSRVSIAAFPVNSDGCPPAYVVTNSLARKPKQSREEIRFEYSRFDKANSMATGIAIELIQGFMYTCFAELPESLGIFGFVVWSKHCHFHMSTLSLAYDDLTNKRGEL